MIEGRTGLDNPKFQGRLRTQNRRSEYERRFAGYARGNVISDIRRPSFDTIGSVNTLVGSAGHAKASVVPTAPTKTPMAPLAPPVFDQHPPKTKIISPDIRPPASRRPQAASAALHTRGAPSLVLKRQGVQAPQISRDGSQHQAVSKRLRTLFNARALTTAAAVVIVLGGIGIGLHGLKVNKDVAAKTTQLAAATRSMEESGERVSGEIPSETNAPDPAKHAVAADLPRTITISKIGVKARVVRLGTRANNQLAAPTNIFDAGWYNESSKPGEAGAMVIDGHVSGPTKPGVFHKLHTLVAGDQIKIDRGDGKTYTYKVVKKSSYAADKVDMAAVLTPVTPGRPGLNLITCSGEIDSTNNHYKNRAVVFAEQI